VAITNALQREAARHHAEVHVGVVHHASRSRLFVLRIPYAQTPISHSNENSDIATGFSNSHHDFLKRAWLSEFILRFHAVTLTFDI